MSSHSVSITRFITSAIPRPHILYVIELTNRDGETSQISRRYSEFVELHSSLGDSLTLPPKRILSTTFDPSAWEDDSLIAERKAGLSSYLNKLLADSKYDASPLLNKFLTSPTYQDPVEISLEDSLPSTLTKEKALEVEKQLVSAASTPVAAAYYPEWAVDSNPPEGLDYSKFDVLFFAFAYPDSSNGITWDDGSQSTLQRLVTSARKSGNGTKVVLSIGGGSHSYWFSNTMSSAANRATFVDAAVSAVNTYGLDGIDVDWEYPNQIGTGNPYSPDDAANLLLFFTSLRSALGPAKIIATAVTVLPFTGPNGSPLTNVASFADPLTYLNIMNYDTWGASANPGPNAPLGDLCGTSRQPQASAEAAFNQWQAAGFPPHKMLLGLPLYGYVSESTATTLSDIAMPPAGFQLDEYKERVLNLPRRNNAAACPIPAVKGEGEPNFLNGKHERTKIGPQVKVGATPGDLSSYFGQAIAFNQIVALGALEKSGDVYVQANGYTRGWDECSDTPFLFDVARRTVVTYDDTDSLADKAAFAKQSGMAGCFTWSFNQDDGYALQDSIRSALGK